MRPLTDFLQSSYTRVRSLFGKEAPPNTSAAPATHTPNADSEQFAQARVFHQRLQLDEAEAIYRALLNKYPKDFDLLHLLGVIQGQRNKLPEAIVLLEQALAINPQSAAAHCGHGNALKGSGKLEEALICHERALALQPNDAEIWNSHGATLADLGQYAKALESYDRALIIRPDHVLALDNRGITLQALRRPTEALASHQRALMLQPDYAPAHYGHGLALAKLKRPEEALTSYDQARALRPDHIETLIAQGAAFRELNRPAEALHSFEQALKISPELAIAHYNCGIALADLKHHEAALACYDRALAYLPYLVEAHDNRGSTLRALHRYEEALSSFGKGLAVNCDHLSSLHNRGDLLLYMSRAEEGAKDYAKLAELAPDFEFALGSLLRARMLCCDWRNLNILSSAITSGIGQGKKSTEPFAYLAIATAPELMKRCAEIYSIEKFPPVENSALPPFAPRKHGKIRLGYVAGEFRHHATSILLADLLERHDATRFELFAFDNGWDDGSEMRKRLEKVFTQIVDISKLTDLEAAIDIRTRGIDILVDLNGHVGFKRTGIFSHRAAPIQVNWLGFPGTMGAAYIDYIVGDVNTIPAGSDVYYSEKVVRLPDTYQANDSKRAISSHIPTRSEVGLPESGFVFCSFNKNYKITPSMFDIWMRLLHKVNHSVLWLLEDNAAASRNLRAEATARGISPDRLVFALHLKLPDHLARHPLADLFLDTLPCNAHTTASDALWTGLPVLTCMGSTFAGRVAGSLLHAIGLPDLVTENLQDYEALALKLATTPTLLSDLRIRLANNRTTRPLFDSNRFRHHIETAYAAMYERMIRGELPESVSIQPRN